MVKTKKNDFIEIEFIGKIKDGGEIFDTNIGKEAEKINLKIEAKPLVICISQGMLVKGFDKALEEKETGEKYKITLEPKDAFGTRNPQLTKLIPLNVFKTKNINPVPGMMLNLDGMIAKIITVSGGRVITDFNNPLAGKDIEYEFTVKRKIIDEKEKIESLQDFFFKKRFSFSVKEKNIIFEKATEPFLKIFGNKFKEILNKDIEIEKAEKAGKADKKGIKENSRKVSDKKHIKEK